jgi:hypothetical protein
MHCSVYLILSSDYSVIWSWHSNFDSGLLRLPDLIIPLTWYRVKAHDGCDRSEEDACSSSAPDLTFAFVGGLCCSTLDFVFAFWITIIFFYTIMTMLTSLFYIHQRGRCKKSQNRPYEMGKIKIKFWQFIFCKEDWANMRIYRDGEYFLSLALVCLRFLVPNITKSKNMVKITIFLQRNAQIHIEHSYAPSAS